MSQLLALVSAVLFGVADFAGGFVTRHLPVWKVISWSQLLGLPLLVVGLLVVPAEEITALDLALGAVGGIAGLAGLAILYSTLAAGTMSVVAPISGAVAAAIPVIFDLSRGEELSQLQIFGIVLALAAVLLVGLDHSARHLDGRLLLQAAAAGAAFAVFFIALGFTDEASGLWPLVAARSATVPIAFAVALALGVAARPRDDDLRLVAVAGTLDMGANVAIALALQRGPIGVSSVLSSLYPAVTAIVAVVVLKERPSTQQLVGIGCALVAVLALAL
ncbi:MAG: EamA family transporter [Actinomycetota bacterium]|nr:EamA family transporter [Actinomycetota bacterium]